MVLYMDGAKEKGFKIEKETLMDYRFANSLILNKSGGGTSKFGKVGKAISKTSKKAKGKAR